MRTKRVFKKTMDDWYPSYILSTKTYPNKGPNLVEVSFLQMSNGVFRVCVWGGDDTGMDFDRVDRDEAKAMFEHLLDLDYVNKSNLERLGFTYA